MPDIHPDDVTALLIEWTRGDKAAVDKLLPLVHDELRRLARRQMAGERPGHVLQATALVNEVYLKLIDIRRVQWQPAKYSWVAKKTASAVQSRNAPAALSSRLVAGRRISNPPACAGDAVVDN